MTKQSAGILLYRWRDKELEVLLVHPGGPYWAKKDAGAWQIPKGARNPHEDALSAAQREFREETGFPVQGPFLPLGTVKQSGGKLVTAWAMQGDCNPQELVSNTFPMEWPPRSGVMVDVPEVDRAAWFSLSSAREYLLTSQQAFLDALIRVTAAD